jgi:dTDP-4-amino-4,6-dideoxygalactose transaminase
MHLEEHKSRKKEIYERYKQGFKDLPLTMNPYLEDSDPNFWLSCILLNEGVKVTPTQIMEKLNAENIESRPLWKPMHMQPVFKDNDFITADGRAVNEDLFSRGLCLPSDIKMTESEQDGVIELIKSIF